VVRHISARAAVALLVRIGLRFRARVRMDLPDVELWVDETLAGNEASWQNL